MARSRSVGMICLVELQRSSVQDLDKSCGHLVWRRTLTMCAAKQVFAGKTLPSDIRYILDSLNPVTTDQSHMLESDR